MSRFTRRRFLATAPAVAGVLSAGKGLGWAEPEKSALEKSETDNETLWYTAPAREWVDALPIGNGRLGAMVFGGGWTDPGPTNRPGAHPDHSNAELAAPNPAMETLQLNEDTLWSGMPVDGNNQHAKEYLPEVRRAVLEEKDYHKADELCKKMQGLFAEAYQVIGSLHVDCKHTEPLTEYRRELHLATAVTRTSYKAGEVGFERTAFASAPDQAIVLRLSASKAGALNASLWMDGPLVTTVVAEGRNRLLLTGKAPKHIAGAGHPGSEKPVVLSDEPGEGMYFAAVLEARVEGGRMLSRTETSSAFKERQVARSF